MKNILKTIIVIFLLVSSVSCNQDSFFELQRPNQYPWTTVSELELAVRQPYLLMMGNAWGSPVGALGLRGFAESDVCQYIEGITGASYYYEYYTRQWKTTVLNNDRELESAFSYLYQISTATNAPLQLISNAEKAGKDVFDNMTESDRQTVKRYKGELLFMRAVGYWYLARTWAPPYNPDGSSNTGKYFVLRRDYVNGADDIKNGALATVEEVYASIVQDLKDAISILPTTYVTTELSQRSRVNKYAAEAMLARIYFYMGKFALSKTLLDDIINSGMYNMKDDPIQAFNKVAGEGSSGEILWEIAINSTSSKFDRNPSIFSKNNYTANGGRGTNWNHCAWACFTLSYTACQQIGWMNKDLSVGPTAVADKRYTQTYIRLEAYKANPWNASTNPVEYWAHQNTYETRYPIPVPFIWQDKHFRAPTSGRRSNRAMLRLAEVYLTRATLRLKDGDKPGAADDLNAVRTRAGLPNIASADITELAIENERIKELTGEHADRLLYLIAMRRPIGIGDRDPGKYSAIQPPYTDYYWQIPLAEQQQNQAYQK